MSPSPSFSAQQHRNRSGEPIGSPLWFGSVGVLITALLSSPAVIRGQWTVSRLKRQVSDLEHRLAEQEKQNAKLAADLAVELAARPQPVEVVVEKPYVGLRALLGGNREAPASSAPEKPGTSESMP